MNPRTMARSGFVAIVGRPSAGKSTLLNALCGHKISIVSPVPQTTRNRIRGILTDRRGQIVFLDTPGFHNSERRFNRYMRDLVLESLEEVEAVLYVLDATRSPGEEESTLAHMLSEVRMPVVCAVNKTDHPRNAAADVAAFARQHLPTAEIRLVSAATGAGLAELTDTLFVPLPEGEPYYPEEFYTDQEPALRIAEIVREKAIFELTQELPHALYVEIADMEMRAGSAGAEGHLWVRAFVVVERESQKGIVVGRGGARVRDIRMKAEAELAEIFPYPVKLDLRVKAQPKWRTNETLLKRIVR
ncbi:MAG: GTPase Era [Spirochaetaceae bacterium]